MSTREEDVATEMFICNTHNYILFFTDKGRVYRIKCYAIPEGTRQSKGMNIANILPIATDEKVTSMIPVKEFEDDNEYYWVVMDPSNRCKDGVLNELW